MIARDILGIPEEVKLWVSPRKTIPANEMRDRLLDKLRVKVEVWLR